MNKMSHRHVLILLSALSLGAGSVRAQTAPREATPPVDKDEIVTLSPFVVSADEDAGSYRATSTLAGSRVRTDLKDIASSISVVTAQFLKDTGATNNESLLVYTTNTEVAGIYGNMAGVGNTYVQGASESVTNLLRQARWENASVRLKHSTSLRHRVNFPLAA